MNMSYEVHKLLMIGEERKHQYGISNSSLHEERILNQYYQEKQRIVDFYTEKILRLPNGWEQKLLDELNNQLEILGKQLGIQELKYGS